MSTMGLSLLAVCFVLTSHLVSRTLAAGPPFFYDRQNEWPDICNAGNTGRQSPIDIITTNVAQSLNLSPLVFGLSWNEATSNGSFHNNGHSVQFTLEDSSPQKMTETSVGTYRLLQFHFHWGNQSGVGSEHLINGEQAELEIHFVHQIVGNNDDPGKANAVVGVLADVDETATISGIWEQLDPTLVPYSGNSTAVSGVNISEFLPTNRDYYYYEGSLTTPPCTESVQWFVLQNRIKVPAAYLANLRSNIRGSEGDILIKNFRDVQPLNGRVVSTASSSVRIYSSTFSVVFLALMALVSAGHCGV